MDSHEDREHRTNRLLIGAFVALLLIVTAVALPRMANGSVLTYERTAPRDPGTRYLKGMSPRDLGPENAERAILFVHGFSGSPTNYNDLPDWIARDGWRVRCMTVPGHCTSPSDFEKATGQEMLEGVLAEVRALKAKYKTVVIAGHSLGGCLVTLAAAREPVDALILYAPFFGLTRDDASSIKTATIVNAISKVVRWAPRGGDTTQPVAYAPNRKFIRSYEWIPAQAGLTALGLGEQLNAEAPMKNITCPVLLIHSLGDRVNSPRAAAKAFEEFPNPQKRAFYPVKSDHILFWDYDRLPTIYETRAFLDRVFPA